LRALCNVRHHIDPLGCAPAYRLALAKCYCAVVHGKVIRALQQSAKPLTSGPVSWSARPDQLAGGGCEHATLAIHLQKLKAYVDGVVTRPAFGRNEHNDTYRAVKLAVRYLLQHGLLDFHNSSILTRAAPAF
jgi:hypothetical protein